jgi:mannose/fructose/N-acetylgalactosamine-specific phosphotransferase system component IIC
MAESIFLALLAALVSLDVTAFGQFMISRPIVVKTGIWLGMIVEMIWVNVIPMGASVPPDTTAIAILAMVWGMRSMPNNPSAMVLALVLAVPAAVLFRLIDVAQRYLHVRIARWVQEGDASGLEHRVSIGVYVGLSLFFTKAFIFYVALMYAGTLLTRTVFMRLSYGAISGMGIAWRVLPVIGLAFMLKNFSVNFLSAKK